MSKTKKDKDAWIAETQQFQRIAKVPESSYEELAKEWDDMIESRRRPK